MEKLLQMIKQEVGDNDTNGDDEEGESISQKTIFRQPPQYILDNYFADEKIVKLLGPPLHNYQVTPFGGMSM
jgi:hypothetical protein